MKLSRAVTIALCFIGILAGLIALIAILGALTPRTHTATRQAVFKEKPDALYAVVDDWAAQPSWRSGLKAVEMLPTQNGMASYREESRHGAITYVVTENTPGQKLVVKIAGQNLPFGGAWTFEFTDSPEGGRLRITEQAEIKNIFFRFFARYIFGYAGTMEDYLRDLGKKFDETVNPQE